MTILLKIIKNSLINWFPLFGGNRVLNAPFNVKRYSTYINIKLNTMQKNYLTDYIREYTPNLSLVPIKLGKFDCCDDYYLSVNIYNCSSPLFINGEVDVARCEINTYVKDQQNNYGTIILDYNTNGISLDPVNLFKAPVASVCKIIKHSGDAGGAIKCVANDNKINLQIKYTIPTQRCGSTMQKNYYMSPQLIKYTDNIYYKNGICDKLYYDSSLIDASTKIPQNYADFYFKYKDLEFNRFDSIFYFNNDLNFVCSLWNNLRTK